MTYSLTAITLLFVITLAVSAIALTYRREYEKARRKNMELLAQVALHKKAVAARSKKNVTEPDTVAEPIAPDLLTAITNTSTTKTYCAAIGCNAVLDFTKLHSFKITGVYKPHSSERLVRFICTGCVGKKVWAGSI